MSLISRVKSILTRRRLKQASTKSLSRVNHDFVDIDQAKRVGFIVNVQDINEKDKGRLTQYVNQLKKAKKDVFLVELNFIKKSTPIFTNLSNGVFINPEKLNWLGLPTTDVESKFAQTEMDILMNFDNSNNPTAQYLCRLANARTRTGVYVEGQEACYELMLSLPENGQKVPAMLDQFDFYLKMLEK
ncbi:MAG: hypothetical protein AB8F95_07630 [Bacteroidia bacterium]